MLNLIIGLLITMVFSAFFSGMEIAFVSSNRMLVEMERDKKKLSQRVLSRFYRHPNNFVSTMLVGNNISLVIYGILFAKIFDQTIFAPLEEGQRVLADTLLSTLVVLFTGEFLPKTIFKSAPNSLLSFFALPAFACYVLLYPISRFATQLSKLLLSCIGIRMDREQGDKEFSKVDLDYLVQTSIENAGDDKEIDEEVKIFHNALDFSDTKVKDCMVPRTEIEAIDINNCNDEMLVNQFINSGFSKIIVYDEDIDHVVGYIHSSELFRNPQHAKEHIQRIPYVPETMTAKKLMHILLQQKKSLAIVVDEFGGTSGLVSLEDIVEEIFGDIEDEHDVVTYTAKKVGDNEYLLSARLEIEKVNEQFGIHLPESDEYLTVGGYILYHHQAFPKTGQILTIDKFQFTIIKTATSKIELVKLKVNP